MAVITADDLRVHLRLTDPSAQDTPALTVAVNAANQAVINYCHRTFDATTTASASARVYRPKTPTLTVTDDFWTTTALTVAVDSSQNNSYGTTLTLNTDFLLEPLNGMEDGQTVPYRRLIGFSGVFNCWAQFPYVRVTAAWGWASVPAVVKDATLIKAARLFYRRNSPEGFAGGFSEFGPARITSREDPDCAMLLQPYIRDAIPT